MHDTVALRRGDTRDPWGRISPSPFGISRLFSSLLLPGPGL